MNRRTITRRTTRATPHISALILGAVGMMALACSTRASSTSDGGMGFTGVQSAVNDVIGTPEERMKKRCEATAARNRGIDEGKKGAPADASRYEKCPDDYRASAVAAYNDGYNVGLTSHAAEICRTDVARKKGLRHGRWSMTQNATSLDVCPEPQRSELIEVYVAAFAVGRSEVEQSRRYFADQERFCSASISYELGYDHGLDGESRDTATIQQCEDEDMKQGALVEYNLGHDEGTSRRKIIERERAAERQKVVCDAEIAFTTGIRDGQSHTSMNVAWLTQCDDASLREDAQFRYEIGYMQGFGMEVVQAAIDRENQLGARYRALPAGQRVACNLNDALEVGYSDGYYGEREGRRIFEACEDAMLREEALTRYAYGREQGAAAHLEEKGYTAQDYQAKQVCSKELAYEAGRNDGSAFRPMDSSWLNDCRDESSQSKARRAYRRGYDEALW